MTLSRITDNPTTIETLGFELKDHLAGIEIDYLYDHGWQVTLSNPGGHLYVHAHDYPNKLGSPGAPDHELSLEATIAKAIEQAKLEGWW